MRIAVVDLYPEGRAPSGKSIAEVVSAIQRQIDHDFARIWGCTATLTFRRAPGAVNVGALEGIADIDGIVYVAPEVGENAEPEFVGRKLPNAAAFHYRQLAGVPCGFIFPEVAEPAGCSWTVLLSHEILEMIIDPDLNLLVGGIHPDTKKTILVAYEVCDPVQASSYPIDGIQVGNFVTPQFFKPKPRRGPRWEDTNFCNEPLKPFNVLDGGYYSFFDPSRGAWDVYPRPEFALWRDPKDETGDASRGKRRRAAFLKMAPESNEKEWPTLVYGCANLSQCGRRGGGN